MKLLTVSPAPHIRDKASTRSIMLDVLIALAPTLVASIVIFGFQALLVTGVCVGMAVLSEFVFEKGVKKSVTINDLSAVVTGVLLSFCLPVDIPLWIAGLGSVIAIVVVKQLFGGIGQNFANPAITARVVLLISFGGAMSTYAIDGVTSATPLAAGAANPGVLGMFLGNHAGSLGETCALTLLIGGAYLVVRKVISWHIPVAYIGTVAVVSLVAQQDLSIQLMGGGLLLGAIFMATDYATSPATPRGQLLYGVGCGVLTVLFRYNGLFPGGVTYAILLMNAAVWLIDRYTAPRRFGAVKGGAA